MFLSCGHSICRNCLFYLPLPTQCPTCRQAIVQGGVSRAPSHPTPNPRWRGFSGGGVWSATPTPPRDAPEGPDLRNVPKNYALLEMLGAATRASHGAAPAALGAPPGAEEVEAACVAVAVGVAGPRGRMAEAVACLPRRCTDDEDQDPLSPEDWASPSALVPVLATRLPLLHRLVTGWAKRYGAAQGVVVDPRGRRAVTDADAMNEEMRRLILSAHGHKCRGGCLWMVAEAVASLHRGRRLFSEATATAIDGVEDREGERPGKRARPDHGRPSSAGLASVAPTAAAVAVAVPAPGEDALVEDLLAHVARGGGILPVWRERVVPRLGGTFRDLGPERRPETHPGRSLPMLFFVGFTPPRESGRRSAPF